MSKKIVAKKKNDKLDTKKNKNSLSEEERQIFDAIMSASSEPIIVDSASQPHTASVASMLSNLNGAKSDVSSSGAYHQTTPSSEPATHYNANPTTHSPSYSQPSFSTAGSTSSIGLSTLGYVAGGLLVAGGVAAAAAGGGGSSSTTTTPPPATTPPPSSTTDVQTSTPTSSSTTAYKATTTIVQSGDIRIDSLVDGVKYGAEKGTGTTLTYSFPWTTNTTATWEANYGSGENTATTTYGFNSAQISAAKLALSSWGNIANVSFAEVAETSTTVGDIRFGFSSTVSNTNQWGWSYMPSQTDEAGDIWIATNLDAYNSDFSITGVGYSSLIHELGHTLGLKHCGDIGAGEDGPFLDAAHDNKLYSVMSYNIPKNNMWFDTVTNKWCYVMDQTPMIYDMLALQYIYGKNNTYKTGDDTYTYDNIAPFRATIWDAGGIDTISVANSSRGSLINLNEGEFSSIQTSRFYSAVLQADGTSKEGISSTLDGTYNLGIAYGAVIENATGGSGNDTLIGNQYSNVLTGGTGADAFVFQSVAHSTNADTITDFNHIDDTIRLDDAAFSKLALGALSSTMFKSGVATDSDDYILYNATTGNLSYDLDGNGAGASIVFANLSNKPTNIDYTDFVVI